MHFDVRNVQATLVGILGSLAQRFAMSAPVMHIDVCLLQATMLGMRLSSENCKLIIVTSAGVLLQARISLYAILQAVGRGGVQCSRGVAHDS